jgi:hypothetical protein
VAALYRRSVHLTLASRSWLAPAFQEEEGVAPEDRAALHAALAAQDAAVAAAASAVLLANFRALLASLLGEALASRLLAPQQRSPPDGDVAKEPLP